MPVQKKYWMKSMQQSNNSIVKGKVYLVGSGPGAYDLMTTKAIELLKIADVLVYDRLVCTRAIDLHCPENCEKIYVGKAGLNHTVKQDEINKILRK